MRGRDSGCKRNTLSLVREMWPARAARRPFWIPPLEHWVDPTAALRGPASLSHVWARGLGRHTPANSGSAREGAELRSWLPDCPSSPPGPLDFAVPSSHASGQRPPSCSSTRSMPSAPSATQRAGRCRQAKRVACHLSALAQNPPALAMPQRSNDPVLVAAAELLSQLDSLRSGRGATADSRSGPLAPVVVIAATNRRHHLDPALCRPGMLQLHSSSSSREASRPTLVPCRPRCRQAGSRGGLRASQPTGEDRSAGGAAGGRQGPGGYCQ